MYTEETSEIDNVNYIKDLIDTLFLDTTLVQIEKYTKNPSLINHSHLIILKNSCDCLTFKNFINQRIFRVRFSF
ncbi:hypothetical protein PUN28_015212 [Cardiocondyla obscurior]|uniref:Uncharacterized protein n=1 Tax=Cardiocondyla obscurior TaxID=286306 RepID=A0AAW2EZX5_9HYME